MTAFPVASSIPIPPKPKRGNPGFGKPATYPWADMKVGSSFFVPLARGKGFTAHTARMKQNPNNGTYEMRRVVENGTDGVRVWRTK